MLGIAFCALGFAICLANLFVDEQIAHIGLSFTVIGLMLIKTRRT